jgi:hypothetical protein
MNVSILYNSSRKLVSNNKKMIINAIIGNKVLSNTIQPKSNNIQQCHRQYTTSPNNQELYRTFKTRSLDPKYTDNYKPGSKAFAECESDAIQDLFFQFAKVADNGGVDEEGSYLSFNGVKELLGSIGEKPDDATLKRLFQEADLNNDKKLHLDVSLMKFWCIMYQRGDIINTRQSWHFLLFIKFQSLL